MVIGENIISPALERYRLFIRCRFVRVLFDTAVVRNCYSTMLIVILFVYIGQAFSSVYGV